jgi:hypothetical protein
MGQYLAMKMTFKQEFLAALLEHKVIRLSLEQYILLSPVIPVNHRSYAAARKYTAATYGVMKGEDELTYTVAFTELPIRYRLCIVYFPERALANPQDKIIRIARTMRAHCEYKDSHGTADPSGRKTRFFLRVYGTTTKPKGIK